MQRSQKSSRVNLQKSDVQPKPLNRLWVGGSKTNLQQQQMRTRLEPSGEMSRESGVPAAFQQIGNTVEGRNSGGGAVFKPSSSMRTKENSRKEKNNEVFFFRAVSQIRTKEPRIRSTSVPSSVLEAGETAAH